MEIFDLIRDIKDPEHDGGACAAQAHVRVLCAGTARRFCACSPRCAILRDLARWFHDTTIRLSRSDLTLEALNVLRLTNVTVDNARNKIHVFFTPTGACWPRVPCGR